MLFVEATSFPGEGKLQVTGQLGDVMKESAPAALSYVKRNVAALGDDVPEDWFRDNDVHLHVPAGAIPKDGPSAGITMATALASLVTGGRCASDTAMTGEITLTGQVLPIGGLKEKALAAQRAGIKRVIAPQRNEPDARRLPGQPAEGDGVRVRRHRRRGACRGAGPSAELRPGVGERRAGALAGRRASRWRQEPVPRGSVRVRSAAASGAEESYGSEEEGRKGRSRSGGSRSGRPEQPIRAAAGRGRRSARRPAHGLRVGAQGLRAHERQGPDAKALEDKKVQKDLKEAADSLKSAADSLRAPPKRKKRRGRLLLVGIVGAGPRAALSESLRSKVLDALFGAEEEFEYTSTTTPHPVVRLPPSRSPSALSARPLLAKACRRRPAGRLRRFAAVS